MLGYACLNVRHLVDPDVIVLGGGMIEGLRGLYHAGCPAHRGRRSVLRRREGGGIRLSALGDDAVLLGSVAAARLKAGRNPFKKRYRARPVYPQIDACKDGAITVDDKAYKCDIYITVNGKTKKRQEIPSQNAQASPHTIGARELETVCKGGPEILFIGTGKCGQMELDENARRFLELRSIKFKILPNPKAVECYNKSKRRRAALMHVGC